MSEMTSQKAISLLIQMYSKFTSDIGENKADYADAIAYVAQRVPWGEPIVLGNRFDELGIFNDGRKKCETK